MGTCSVLSNLYNHRRYIWKNAWYDLRYHYSGTAIGVFWSIINPILEIMVYTFVFAFLLSVAGRSSSYVLYLSAGLLPWRVFADSILRGSNAFIEHSTHMKRLTIPPEIFVAKIVLSATFVLSIYLFILLLAILFFGHLPGWEIVFLPLLAILLQGFAFGIALVVAHLRVCFLDLGEILAFVLYFWRWTMPIIYSDTLVGENVQPWFNLNPPYVYIRSIRDVLLQKKMPALDEWSMMAGWLVVFLLIGSLVHEKLQSEVREYI